MTPTPPAADSVDEFLTAYRRRRLAQEGAAGACYLAAGVAGLWLLASLIGWAGGGLGGLRWVLWAAAALGGVLLSYRYGLRPRRRLARDGQALARELERGLGRGDLELVSAVQLAGRPAASAELVAAHRGRVAERLAGRTPGQLAPAGRWRRPAVTLGGMLGLLGLAALVAPGALGAAAAALLRPAAAVGPVAAAARESWVGDIRLTYSYPAYTDREERRVEGSDGAVLALPGTRVTIAARADRPIAAGRLDLGDQAVELQVAGGRQLRATLVVEQPGAYRFALESAAGERWRSPRSHPIQIEPDEPPRVRLSEPARDQVVRETDAVDLLYDARDDFALGEVHLVWRVPGRAAAAGRRLLQRLAGRGRDAVRQRLRWQLAELDLVPGDQLQFYIEASDNDTVRGPKTGRSASVTLEVFSAEAHHRELMARVQQLWERLLGNLATDLEHADRAAQDAEPEVADQRQLREQLQTTVTAADDLVAALAEDRLAWPPVAEALAVVRAGLEREVDRLGWALQNAAAVRPGRPAREPDTTALAALRRARLGRLERDALYLEDLLDLERLEDIERIARELERSQRELADLMERYRRAPDERTRRAIEARIAQLKQQMARLLERQHELLKAVRDEYINPEALRRHLSQRDAMGTLDRIQRALLEGDLDSAMAEIERLGDQVRSLQQAVARSKAGFGSQRYRELARKLEQLRGELNQITEQQTRLTEQTGELRRRVGERIEKRARRIEQGRLEQLRGELAAVIAALEAIAGGEGEADALERYANRERDGALETARGLDRLLGAGDLAGSLEQAEALAAGTERLESLLESLARFRPERAGQWHRHSERAATEAAALLRKLRRLMPAGRDLLQPGEAEQVGEQQRRQAELARRLAQLQAEMRRIEQQAPVFGPEMNKGVQRAQRAMQRAGDQLGRQAPRRAWPHQREAQRALEGMQQALRKSCQRGGGQGMPLPMGGVARPGRGMDQGGPGRPSEEPVEIPGAEEYRPPEAFREALLEGMKDPVPEAYQPQVRRYYEELVK